MICLVFRLFTLVSAPFRLKTRKRERCRGACKLTDELELARKGQKGSEDGNSILTPIPRDAPTIAYEGIVN